MNERQFQAQVLRHRIRFTVPGQPVPKARPRKGRYGNWYTPTMTRLYEKQVGLEAVLVRTKPWGPDFRGIVKAVLTLNIKGRQDADNCAKAILDGLNGVMWHDDSQVRDLQVVVKRQPPYGALVELEVCSEQDG